MLHTSHSFYIGNTQKSGPHCQTCALFISVSTFLIFHCDVAQTELKGYLTLLLSVFLCFHDGTFSTDARVLQTLNLKIWKHPHVTAQTAWKPSARLPVSVKRKSRGSIAVSKPSAQLG